jgi:hypothetical protein
VFAEPLPNDNPGIIFVFDDRYQEVSSYDSFIVTALHVTILLWLVSVTKVDLL